MQNSMDEMGMLFCSLTVQQSQPESWEREQAAARSQQPQSHSTAPLSSSQTKPPKLELLHKDAPNPTGVEGHPLTPAGIWGPRRTATPPLSSKPGTETAAPPRFCQQVKHWDLGSHMEEEAQPEKKGFSSKSQQQLDVVIISEIHVVESHRIKPWMEKEPMKPA